MRMYRNAIMVQRACNLVAVLNSWAKVIEDIREEAKAKGIICDSSHVAKHPVHIMYATQVAHLTGFDGSGPQYAAAYEACQNAPE